MALITLKCNHLMPCCFKGLMPSRHMIQLSQHDGSHQHRLNQQHVFFISCSNLKNSTVS